MKKNWLFAGVVGLVAAILYFCSVADYAFPGTSAHLMAVWKGLVSDSGVSFPLMAVFAKALGGGNLIAPICGVVSVVVLFHLVAAAVRGRIKEEKIVGRRNRISLIAALVASITFMLTPAVRSAATHLEPRMFDFTWALLCFVLVFPFYRCAKSLSLLFPIALGAMVAFGLCDSAIFLMFLPFYYVQVVSVALHHGRRVYLSSFLFVMTAVIVFFVAARVLDAGTVNVVKAIAKELRAYKATPGWLFVLAFSTVPFLVSIFSSAKSFGEKPGLVSWLFHGAMSFVLILAFATPLSPSSLMEPYGVLPVLTSAFVAVVAGYLVAWWWANRRSVVAMVSGGILVFVLSVTCIWNLFSFDGDAGRFADQVAERILSDLGGRKWFVTDGLLDDHLELVAAKGGKTIHLVSLARDLDEQYLEELGKVVEAEGVGGSKNGTLRLSLSLGVLPFVQDWFASDPSVKDDVAIFGAPDLWYSAGLTPVPEVFFFGANEKVVPDWSVWKELNEILFAPKGWGSYRDREITNPVDRLRLHLRRHLGFVANNRGVYLQDGKRDDEAFAMYELVLNEIDCDNICTVFNEVAMVGQGHSKALKKKKELESMLKSAVDDKHRRYLLWRLGTYYGYIRNPDSFVRLGYAWARSGRPGDALSQIRRAIDFVPTDKRSILLNMMASLYASGNDPNKSRSLYESVLKANKDDHDALIGLMRLELMAGNSTKALDYLQRAVKSTKDATRANIEQAMVMMMKNDLVQARALIKRVTDADPKNMQAWSLLSAVTMQQIDSTKGEKAKAALTKELEEVILPAMEKQARDQFDYYLQSTKGFVLLRKGEESRRKAREAFIAASRSRPDIGATQDLVLGLDISLDDKGSAETHAKEVLRRNRNAPLANYVMGSLALGRGRYVEAEAYLRRAADAPQPVPLALNDLAEVLRRQKQYSEAEKYARKAVEKAPGLYVAWETLGSILMDADLNLGEAEAAIRKACQLSKDKNGKEADIRMLVSLARVQIKNGDKEHAKITIHKVKARIKELSDFERKEFEEREKKPDFDARAVEHSLRIEFDNGEAVNINFCYLHMIWSAFGPDLLFAAGQMKESKNRALIARSKDGKIRGMVMWITVLAGDKTKCMLAAKSVNA